ncbi:MAG: hypothetical protein A2W05_00705 [Candidatus Schekmanbacteria bacterium RBG_16_38_10]|uniref:Uncharacterized protein n=1 Tax=Candidatus Schekmanbacteria bacterium RBG_16_38_10 TaxID=1817879 RepID=A0A1F7RM55_9BACT|nr:MAG: hypothetical protein A2W05_00705 [Candidatus Schekmanbacteria bacterium RBG_16_38_10]
MSTQVTDQKDKEENITQKILRALKGNKFERMNLIKSSHKLVRQAVLLNPRITEEEISIVTSYKDIEKDVLAKISQKNEWIKNYKVRYNLVTNPKTPPDAALRLLSTLFKKDIENISKNRNVPYAIRLEAARIKLKS